MVKPTKEEIEKLQKEAKEAFDLTMSYEEAEKFLIESAVENEARDRH